MGCKLAALSLILIMGQVFTSEALTVTLGSVSASYALQTGNLLCPMTQVDPLTVGGFSLPQFKCNACKACTAMTSGNVTINGHCVQLLSKVTLNNGTEVDWQRGCVCKRN
ncbi:uncharacterized protein LOC119578364 [Penaeus monodon]|uniref:uncharacterized protein LOC119578364 n=1 Tax=Penaeus monodon TaxID=6687 RepID=UPI0018A70C80|nr:uncharacterized protein LOC119578364 [Penaeus monodon]